MKYYRILFFIVSFHFLSPLLAFSQDSPSVIYGTKEIDSLLSVVETSSNDSLKADLLSIIAFKYKFISENQEARRYADNAYKLSRATGYIPGQVNALKTRAQIHLALSEYDSSEILFKQALSLCDSLDLIGLKGNVLLNFSNLYSQMTEYSIALDYLLTSLNIFEDIEDESRKAAALSNIGVIYFYQNEFDTALFFYERSLHIYKKLKDQSNIASTLLNLGSISWHERKYTKALSYFHESLDTYKELKYKKGMTINYANIAEVLLYLSDMENSSLVRISDIHMYASPRNLKQSLLDSARSYLSKSIILARSTDNQNMIINGLNTLGKIYEREKNYGKAINTFHTAIDMSKRNNQKELLKDSYERIYHLYANLSKYDSAYFYFGQYASLKDSIFSLAKQKEIGQIEIKLKYEKQRLLKDAEYQRQLAVDREELKRQKLMQIFLGSLALLGLIILLIIYRALRISRRQKIEIQEQNRVIEKKNIEILSSIRYASRIQSALLKEEEQITPTLPNHFIFFRPRDIVSGDFYWSVKQDDWWYLAVADCTGHGVPGAFLTMLGTAYLNEIISTPSHLSPDLVLNELRRKIINQLSQSEDIEDSKDGMDISLISINLKTLKAEWAGANNPIYIIRESRGEDIEIMSSDKYCIAEIKGDKQPIGFHSRQFPFTKHEIQFKKGELFYLMSDGFADQFGGPLNKKYRYKPLKNLVLNLMDSDIEKQKPILSEEFDSWKGSEDQVDDVCVIGVRI